MKKSIAYRVEILIKKLKSDYLKDKKYVYFSLNAKYFTFLD